MNLPEHMRKQFWTEREWKTVVRLRLRRAKAALEVCRFGAAYTPDNGEEISNACDCIDRALDLCSVRKWGR